MVDRRGSVFYVAGLSDAFAFTAQMTTSLVTFSDESMSRSRELCIESALRHGVDDYDAWDADELIDRPSPIRRVRLDERGCGYWAWKPLIIDDLLTSTATSDGDIVIYSDAGVEFINNVNYIIDRMDQDIFLFGNNWEHAHWCKKDVIESVWPFRPNRFCGHNGALGWEDFGKQAQASVIFFRVSDYTRKFVKEWLDWCLFEGGRLSDDSPSRFRNHPEFREHRHDQAILTTLAYREGIKLHYWPASYNDGAFTYEKLPEYAGDNYPSPLFNHHRRRNSDWAGLFHGLDGCRQKYADMGVVVE